MKKYEVKKNPNADLNKIREKKYLEPESFFIQFHGEPKVGIFDASWDLSGGFYFEDVEHMEEFRDALQLAFEIATGDKCSIYSNLEWADELEKGRVSCLDLSLAHAQVCFTNWSRLLR